MKLTNKIESIDINTISKKSFRNAYIKKNRPVIIKGILENSPAGKKWSLENLNQRLGQFPVKVFNTDEDNGTSFLVGNNTVPMSKMFDTVKNNAVSNLRMFVNPILKKDKKLSAELPCPQFFKSKFQLSNLMFLGGKGTVVRMHYDLMKDDGLLTQFYGRKEVILIENKQSKLLYKMPLNATSMVNLFEPDYEKYPALEKIEGTRVVLEHGDTLYIPAGYWHQMKYVDASMSVAFRSWNLKNQVTLKMFFVNCFQIISDKTLQALLGKKWLNFKMRVAMNRADRQLIS